MTKPIRLATRKSPLALRQAELVAAALWQTGEVVEIIALSSVGDEITDRPLAEVGGKGLFVKRLQEAMLRGEADAAVHSLKDMEAAGNDDDGFALAAVGFAEDARDALAHRENPAPDDLPAGATIGTCSPRRAALIRRHYPAATVAPMRGNVQTRLDKLRAGEVDALILAAAGIRRLGLNIPAVTLPVEKFIPAVGQGLLAVECCADNTALVKRLARINDARLYRRAVAERAFAAAMQGDCHTALGALATVGAAGETGVSINAFYADDDDDAGGQRYYQTTASDADAATAGKKAAAAIWAARDSDKGGGKNAP